RHCSGRLFERFPRRAGRGMLLRPQPALAQGQSVRHASQVHRCDASQRCRRAPEDGAAGGAEGGLSDARLAAACSRAVGARRGGPGPVSPARAETVTTGLVGSASATHWPIYSGLKLGYYAAADLKLDMIFTPSSAALQQQLTAGSLDAALSTGIVDPIYAIDK